jgi:hypothetical protein
VDSGGASVTVRLGLQGHFLCCESFVHRVGDNDYGTSSCEPRSTLLLDERRVLVPGTCSCEAVCTRAVWLVADVDASGGRRWLSRRAFLRMNDQLPCTSRGPSCRQELGIWG